MLFEMIKNAILLLIASGSLLGLIVLLYVAWDLNTKNEDELAESYGIKLKRDRK